MSAEAGSTLARAQLMLCMDCACFNLRKATRSVTQIYDEILRPSGIRVTQFSLLAAASMAGPITVTRLAELAVMDRTTLTRNLEVLVRQGFINVSAGNDRRTRLVSITPAGGEALAKALPLGEQAQSRVVEALGESHWQSLQENLAEIISMKEPR